MVNIEVIAWLLSCVFLLFTVFAFAMLKLHQSSLEAIREVRTTQEIFAKSENAMQAVHLEMARNNELPEPPEQPPQSAEPYVPPIMLETTDGKHLQYTEKNGQRILENPATGERFVV